MRLLITIIFTLSTLLTLTAQNNWIGGTGFWHDAANWSLGTVPTAQQSVVIDHGRVIIVSHADANRVQIKANSHLLVQNAGSLVINGLNSSASHGIFSSGILEVRGELIVKGIKNGSGIFNNGVVEITGSGQVEIYTVLSQNSFNNFGIRNRGTLSNAGELFIYDINGSGILNWDATANNSGTIHLQNVRQGIVCSSGGMVNSGHLSIVGSTVGGIRHIGYHDYFLNQEGATVTISSASGLGIEVDIYDYFDNFGSIDMTVGAKTRGISNKGYFSNHEGGTIHIDDAATGIHNSSIFGSFSNDGQLLTGANITYNSLHNLTIFTNSRCAELKTATRWNNSGTLKNEGRWYHDTPTNSWSSISGQVINDGVIEDYQGTFPTINNNEIIARPMLGTIQAGVTVPNALDVGASYPYYYIVKGWYTSADMTQSAGNHDLMLNTWTPNANAIGLSEVFVEINYVSDDCNAILRVAIPGGVTPLLAPVPSSTLSGQQAEVSLGGNLAYPNPNNGTFTWETAQPLTGHLSLQLFDLTGRAVWQQQLETDGQRHFPITLDNQMASGTYLLTAWHNGARVGQERVVIAK